MTEQEMSKPPISIIGAGISGLVLGQCLRRRNIPAIIYERVKASPTRNNYGITLYKETYKPLLETLRTSENEFRHRVAVCSPETGNVVSDDSRLRVNRAALSNLLQEGLDIRWEHKLNGISASDSTRKITFQVGEQARDQDYGLIIGADGVHSATRKALNLPSSAFDLKVLPYIVFNGKRRMSYSKLPSGLLDCFTIPNGLTHTEGIAVLSIKADFWDAEKQTVAVSYTLSRLADKEDQPFLDRNISEAEELAKRFVDEVAALGDLPAPFEQVFNPETMGEDRLLHWLMRSSLLESDAIQQAASRSGVLLMGDAAHAQPIPGNGANLAIADAMKLAECIESVDEYDAAVFVKAREQEWTADRRDVEQALDDQHLTDGSKAKI